MSTDPASSPQTAGADDYQPDPDRDSQALVELFFDRLDHDLAHSAVAATERRALGEEMLARYHALIDIPTDLPDDAARYNQRYVAAVLAAYRTLCGRELPVASSGQDLIGQLISAFIQPLAATVTEGTRAMLDNSPDPFDAMVTFARSRESQDFGAAFRFEHPHDDGDRFYADVHRCGYHELFTQHGAPELTAVLCAFDTNWIQAIDPDRHGFTFTRATTIGLGGSICPFHFQRTRARS
jgi:L-2-amino-thiazoline-4-carboxylic acid hydrolase